MADPKHDDHDDGGVHVHIHSWKLYAGVLGALLVLTAITVATSRVDIDRLFSLGNPVEGVGAWNLGIAVVIATIKAGLVVTFFMHLKDDKRFNALVFLGALLFVGVFLAYTLNDTYYRGRVGDRYNGVQVDPDTGERAPGGIAGPIPGEILERGLAAPEPPAAPAPPAAAAEPAPAAEPDVIDAILGEETAQDVPAEPAEGQGDFIDEIMADEPAEEPAADAPPAEEPAAEPAPEAAEPPPAPAPVVRRPRPPRPAPAEAPAEPEAPSQPEPEPEAEAAE